MRPNPWIVEGVSDRCMELARNGVSASLISDALGSEFGVSVSRNAVIGRVHRLKETLSGIVTRDKPARVHRPRSSDAERKRVQQLLELAIQLELPMSVLQPALAEQAKPRLTFMELKDDRTQCRFTTSNEAPWLFCGQITDEGESFCGNCQKFLYTKAPELSPEERQRRRKQGMTRSREISAEKAFA